MGDFKEGTQLRIVLFSLNAPYVALFPVPYSLVINFATFVSSAKVT